MTIELANSMKQEIACAVRRRVSDWYASEIDNGMGCLYWAHAGAVTLQEFGIDCLIAAGSAKWEAAVDDGVSPTHFGFDWGGDPHTAIRTAPLPEGKTPLPEMHCWLYLPSTKELADFSTAHVPKLAKLLGFAWTGPPLPPYLWAWPGSLYPGALYVPNIDATKLALATLQAGIKEEQ